MWIHQFCNATTGARYFITSNQSFQSSCLDHLNRQALGALKCTGVYLLRCQSSLDSYTCSIVMLVSVQLPDMWGQICEIFKQELHTITSIWLRMQITEIYGHDITVGRAVMCLDFSFALMTGILWRLLGPHDGDIFGIDGNVMEISVWAD